MSTAAPATPAYVTRFTLQQRVEHFITMLVFALLCLTGLPQKFFEAGWADTLVAVFGGIDRTRWIHRFCGVVLAISTVVHFANASLTMLSKKVGFTMVPDRKDFEDSILQLKFYLGMTDKHPQYDRYDYKQKFEYWGLVFGNVIMVVTGFILFFPVQFASLVPGQVIPAAKVAHSNEGLMAFLVITIWHIFNAHLNPDVFPFDASMFTGKISRERMLHEHPLELARMEGRPAGDHGGAGSGHAPGREVG
jgi:formate dehydrogenase gamma subunit